MNRRGFLKACAAGLAIPVIAKLPGSSSVVFGDTVKVYAESFDYGHTLAVAVKYKNHRNAVAMQTRTFDADKVTELLNDWLGQFGAKVTKQDILSASKRPLGDSIPNKMMA